MKSDEMLAKLAEINARYGPVPVKVYNRDYLGDADVSDWLEADIQEIRVEGMEVEVWV